MNKINKNLDNKQQLYIHIGMPKTGSSAIQAFLALNESYLLRHGFSYPNHTGFKQAFQTSAGNVADMAKWIENGNHQAINVILSKTSTKNVILSSEILFIVLKNQPEKFAQYLQGRNYKIICYIREFTDLIESCINQQVKNHYRVDYSNVDNVVASFDYYKCLIKLDSHINIENIIVKKYGNEYFYKGNIYTDFMQTLGLELDDSVVYPEKVVNPSLNRDALEFRIILNKSFFAKKDVDLKYRLNGILAQYSVENNSEVSPLLNQLSRNALNSKYASKEKELAVKYFNDSDCELFHKKPVCDKEYGGFTTGKLSKILAFIEHNDQGLYEEIIDFTKLKLKNNADRLRMLNAVK
ncbi:MAG: hypothetical protein JKY19_10500 [Alcanivoracaceae bacterium]|nr:hypothetical protein [Alcanivoracaceae bacterium]